MKAWWGVLPSGPLQYPREKAGPGQIITKRDRTLTLRRGPKDGGGGTVFDIGQRGKCESQGWSCSQNLGTWEGGGG